MPHFLARWKSKTKRSDEEFKKLLLNKIQTYKGSEDIPSFPR
jgi:hypothetical protein